MPATQLKLEYAHPQGDCDVGIHPSGKYIYTTGGDTHVRIISATDLKDKKSADYRLSQNGGSLAVSPDGSLLAVGSKGGFPTFTISENGAGLTTDRVFSRPAGEPATPAFTLNGMQLACPSHSVDIRLESVSGSGGVPSFKSKHSARFVAFDPKRQYVAVTSDEGFLDLIPTPGTNAATAAASGAVFSDGIRLTEAGARVPARLRVAWAPDGSFLAVPGRASVRLLSRGLWTDDQKAFALEDNGGSVKTVVAVSATGNYVAAGDVAGNVQVWDRRFKEPIASATSTATSSAGSSAMGDDAATRFPVTGLVWNPTANALFVAFESGDVARWDHPVPDHYEKKAAVCVPAPSPSPVTTGAAAATTATATAGAGAGAAAMTDGESKSSLVSPKAAKSSASSSSSAIGKPRAAEPDESKQSPKKKQAVSISDLRKDDDDDGGEKKGKGRAKGKGGARSDDEDDDEGDDDEEFESEFDDDTGSSTKLFIPGFNKKGKGVDAASSEGGAAVGSFADLTALLQKGKQAPFQPGSTPSSERRWYMAFNSHGKIEVVSQEGVLNTVTVRLTGVQQAAQSLTERHGAVMGALGANGVLLGAPGRRAQRVKPASFATSQQSRLDFHAHGANNWAERSWSKVLPEDEHVEAVAVGEGWAAAATSTREVHLYSHMGIELTNFALPGDVVTMVGGVTYLAVVCHSGALPNLGDQNLHVILCQIDVGCQDSANALRIIADAPLPLSRGATLSWLGMSEADMLVSYDSAGIIRTLLTNAGNRWLRVEEDRPQKGDRVWPIAVIWPNATPSVCSLSCMVLKGARSYPMQDTASSLFKLRAPVSATADDKEKRLAEVTCMRELALEDAFLTDGRAKLDDTTQAWVDGQFLNLAGQAAQGNLLGRSFDLATKITSVAAISRLLHGFNASGNSGYRDLVKRLDVLLADRTKKRAQASGGAGVPASSPAADKAMASDRLSPVGAARTKAL